METKTKKSQIDMMIDYECGLLNADETIELYQDLLDSGLVWQLQGHYQRTAKTLINEGYITNKKEND